MKTRIYTLFAVLAVIFASCDSSNSEEAQAYAIDTVANIGPWTTLWYDNPTAYPIEIHIDSDSFIASPHVYLQLGLTVGEKRLILKRGSDLITDTLVHLVEGKSYFLNAGKKDYVVQLVNYGEDSAKPDQKLDQNRKYFTNRVVAKRSKYYESEKLYNFSMILSNELLLEKFWTREPYDFLTSFEYMKKEEAPDGYLRKLFRFDQVEMQTSCETIVMLASSEINRLMMVMDLLDTKSKAEIQEIKDECSDCADVIEKLEKIRPEISDIKGMHRLYDSKRRVIFENRVEDSWPICSARLEAKGEASPLSVDQIRYLDLLFDKIKSGLDIVSR